MLNKTMNMRQHIALLELLSESILFELFDIEKFLSRAKGVQALINRGGTEGEKDAAKEAMERMIARAKSEVSELSSSEQASFWKRLDAIRNVASDAAEKASARKSSDDFYKTQQKARPSQEEKDAEYARNKEQQKQQYDNSFVIVSYAEFREGTSDKVYGIVEHKGEYYTFWGRNGASLATKGQGARITGYKAAMNIFNSKLKKGYVEKSITPAIKEMIRRNIKL